MKIPPNRILNLLVFISASVFAVPKGPPPPKAPPPPGLPIDGYVFLLLIIAVLYGFYKINNLKLTSK